MASQSTPTLESYDNAAVSKDSWSFWRLFNLSLGFLGIQFGWAIQMGQMGPLLEGLGSVPWITNLIACAGPITGILVQPIVGAMSDRSTHAWGRRRPFILVGALMTALSLVLMPNSPNLLVAATLLWVLDASLNTTQGPYRAMVPDSVPKHQQATAYSLMGFTIGLGSVIAFGVGYILPDMHQLFYLGAVALTAAMVWTVMTNPERPALAQDVAPTAEAPIPAEDGGVFAQTFKSILAMPAAAKKLCLAHSFTWFGWACLFVYFSLFVPHHIFHSSDTTSAVYKEGVQWASLCYLVMNVVCLTCSSLISVLCSTGVSRKLIHTIGLISVAIGLGGMYFASTPQDVMILMGFVGVGWATTLSIPFALLSEHMPPGREGFLMGAFNMFIAAPQVLTSVIVGPAVMSLGNDVTVALEIGCGVMLMAAILLQWVQEQNVTSPQSV